MTMSALAGKTRIRSSVTLALIVVTSMVGIRLGTMRAVAVEEVSWEIVDGPGAATFIYTPQGSIVVSGGPNREGTEGHISVADTGCTSEHYHGTIEGKPDPRPTGCGWGHVAKREDVSAAVLDVTLAIESEQKALDELNAEPPDFDHANDSCAASNFTLQQAVKELDKAADEKGTDGKTVHKIKQKIKAAEFQDKKCVSKTKDEKREAARKAINRGMEDKREALDRIQTAGLSTK